MAIYTESEMPIWFKDYQLDDIRWMVEQENLLSRVGMTLTEIGDNFIKGSLPVDVRTRQPLGVLHGGASCVLAESLGSIASMMVINPETKIAYGSLVTCNHLRPVSGGVITGTARPVHLGRTKHVWDIVIESEAGKCIAKSELTCAVIEKAAHLPSRDSV